MSDIFTISLGTVAFPKLLAEIADPPQQLYVRGSLPRDAPYLAVVGTRRNTRYGKQVTEDFVRELSRAGICIVSGLALGIDGLAHASALEANGKTIAVLGSGIDDEHIYPATHRYLAKKIIDQGGALVSEYPPGFTATKYSFPARNRIIAGLSFGTLVTEAPKKSGALITAYHALDYNRDVFSIPHPITSTQGYGCNNLIARGAQLVSGAEEILFSVGIAPLSAVSEAVLLNEMEQTVYDLLTKEPRHVDKLIATLSCPGGYVMSTLSILEMRGLVKHLGNLLYIRNN